MLPIAFCGHHEGSPSTDGLTDQRQRQHHQSAGDPCEQVVQTRTSGAQPAQASLAVAQHGIQRTGGFERPGQSQWPRCVDQSRRPEASPHEHPEQGGEQAIHGIFTGRFRSGPQDLIHAELCGVTAHDPAETMTGFDRLCIAIGWKNLEHSLHPVFQAFACQGTGQGQNPAHAGKSADPAMAA